MGYMDLTPPTPTHQVPILPQVFIPVHCWTQDKYLDSNQQLRRLAGDWAPRQRGLPNSWHPLLWKKVLHGAPGAYNILDTDREKATAPVDEWVEE